MSDFALALDAALYGDHAHRQNDAALAFVTRRPDHQVRDAGLVRDRNNLTPLADPGFWRTSTKPAVVRQQSGGSTSMHRPSEARFP